MIESTLAKDSLSHRGSLRVFHADMNVAESLSVAQNIAITDDGGNLLSFVRMEGTKLLSKETAISKVMTTTSIRQAMGQLNPTLELELIVAAGGSLINIEGGQALIVANYCVGATGVDSGTGQQGIVIANAETAALISEEPEL
ncbi:heme-binding protein [Halomonas sp. 15WGF]|uniref:GlcG/HbpS family heme-binding protein n=1 Tax=Halomonas sp. 15WGF TaxID=2570357 RepID=UPI0010BEB8FE|nr:heme-binding protein [Halomonas sp. 15WGF]TKJ09527.1 heme-binding protein [Halomonas sp. 15WGF]